MRGIRYLGAAPAIVAFGLACAAPAAAATYSAYDDFSSSSSVWSYGSGTTGSSFTAFTDFYTNDPGDSCSVNGDSVTCGEISPGGLPEVAKITGSTVESGTDLLVANALYLHPGPTTDAIVQFTAPVTSTYSVSGFFETLDTMIQSAGVGVNVVANGTSELSTVLHQPASFAPESVGGVASFSFNVELTAGETIDFGVNDQGMFGNNGTGFDATISDVPEPSSWVMMLLGLSGVGAVVRRRQELRAASPA